MTRIDFYTLAADSSGDRFIFTCRLLERIRAEGLRVLVYCPESEWARHLDRLLWTFREDGFLPHGLVGQVDAEFTPVLIGADQRPPVPTEVLVNLALTPPDDLSPFARVCEPLDQTPSVLEAGRARYRHYRQLGHPLEHHQVRL